jgi:hypothetical protein
MGDDMLCATTFVQAVRCAGAARAPVQALFCLLPPRSRSFVS